MSVSARQVSLAVEALVETLDFRHPADAVLRHFFQERPELGMRERAFVAEAVFGVLRRLRLLSHLAGGQAPRPLVLAWLARVQGMSARALAGALPAADAALLAAMREASADVLPLPVQAELPDWVVERLRTRFADEEILAIGRGMQQPAPLDLRVNTYRRSRDEVLARLAADGIPAAATPYSPVGVRLQDKPAINRHALYLDGSVEVQDEGSQLLGFLVAPRRRDMVVDFCAGAGGKTLLLGALMGSQGRLYAFDVHEKRLAGLRPRLKRAGLSNVHPQLIGSENDPRVRRLAGKIDRVLVDAPCSGFGTLRRNPDMKYRQTEADVLELAARQRAILAAASRLVKPGGRLVYATCSLLHEENAAVVQDFLAGHPDFALVPAAQVLAEQRIPLDTGRYLELFPHLHGTDGFFAAVMQRGGGQG